MVVRAVCVRRVRRVRRIRSRRAVLLDGLGLNLDERPVGCIDTRAAVPDVLSRQVQEPVLLALLPAEDFAAPCCGQEFRGGVGEVAGGCAGLGDPGDVFEMWPARGTGSRV